MHANPVSAAQNTLPVYRQRERTARARVVSHGENPTNWKSLFPQGEDEEEGRIHSYTYSPHPNPLGKCSRLCSTSCVHAVVPDGEGILNIREFQTKERGAALAFALVMLLLLTILGITAVTTSSLQEKMAGNMRDQYMAQQAGDSILFDGQSLIFNQQTKPITSCPPNPAVKIWDSSCLPAAVAAFVGSPAGPNWWLTANNNWWTSVGLLSGVNNTHTSQEPRFVVERIQKAPIDAEIGHKKKVEKYYFRTTGWSVGATDYSGGLIQGVFSKRSDTYAN